mgnify:CR=1 FL=1
MRMDLSESPPARGAAVAAAPLLQLRGLSKRYGPQTVVDGIDLDIGEGEFVCLLGPSGCGKTTLLRMLCGIEPVSSGQVLLRGHNITQTPPAARGFGVVFQSYALFPNLTAMENVAYGLTGLDRARRQARAQEMLDLVGLGALGARFPSQLSGGQQQRVALARALAPNPGLLLLDEPLSALDAQVRHSLRGEIRRLQRALRIPVIMVTHDQDEALAMADRVVLMEAGRIAQQAAPAALYVQPASGFVARFIGRMNLWAAEAVGHGAVRVGAGEVRVEAPVHDAHCTVGIRPEHVELLPWDHARARARDAAPLPPNHYEGRVETLTFCGAYLSLRLVLPALGLHVDAECPTPADGHLPWREGDVCTVHLRAQALRVLSA